MPDPSLSRREFALRSAQVITAGALFSLVLDACGAANPDSSTAPGGSTGTPSAVTLDLTTSTYSALQQTGGAVKLVAKGQKLIACRTDAVTCIAFSAVCTHAGCELPLPAAGVSTCRCHGAKFDGTGKVLKGPARRDLAPVVAVLEGNMVTLTL